MEYGGFGFSLFHGVFGDVQLAISSFLYSGGYFGRHKDSSFDSQVIFRFSLCFTLVWMVKWAANISLIVGMSNSCLLTLDAVTHVHHLSKVSQVPRGNWPG